jgi:cytochrome c
MRSAIGVVAALFLAVVPASAQQATPDPEGAQIFDLVCAMCHSLNPPPKAAPPISHAAAYYLRKYEETDAAAEAMVAYMKEPAEERSVMPPMAIERFGLMPAQAHLTDAQLLAVARYVIALADVGHSHHENHP